MSKKKLFHHVLGIDPGLTGGIASMAAGSVDAMPMFTIGKKGEKREIDPTSFSGWLQRFHGPRAFSLCVLELVHAMPKQGVTSMFNFGLGYGMIRGVLAAHRIPTLLVTPRRWKKELLPEDARADKSGAIEYAKTNFPSVQLVPKGCRKPHDGMADALCLAAYGYKVVTEEPFL